MITSSKEIQKKLDILVNLLVRDFVSGWYTKNISTEPVFLNSVDKSIRLMVKSLIDRIEAIDSKKFLIEKMVFKCYFNILYFFQGPLILEHVVQFRKTEQIMSRETHQEENFVKFFKTPLHTALHSNSSPTTSIEFEYLRKIGELLLYAIAPQKETKSRVVVCLMREILTCKVIQPVIEMLADPDYWNQTIEILVIFFPFSSFKRFSYLSLNRSSNCLKTSNYII